MFARRKIGTTRRFFKIKNRVDCLSTSAKEETHKYIVKSESKDVIIPDVTIPELIYGKMEMFPKFIATESAETGKQYTFEQIRIKSRNLSKHFKQKFKLKDGDIIAYFLPNLPEYVICFLGSLEARLVVTTMNHIYTADEISKQLIDSSPKLIITQSSYLTTLNTALNTARKKIPIIIIKNRQDESLPSGTVDFFELTDTVLDIPDIQPGKSTDVAILPYSSGTTGLPKGVQLTHNNCVANYGQMDSDDFRRSILPSDSFQDVAPTVLPYYHIYGMMLNFLLLGQGVRSIALRKFTPESYIAALEKYLPTIIFAAPPLVLFLAAHNDVKSEYLKNLRLLSSGAAPLGHLDEERFTKKVGREDVSVVQGYGLTECSPTISFTPNYVVKSERNSGSVGKILPNTTIKIINPEDPTGTPLGPNERGEILVKGPQVMKGYYKRPEETKNIYLDGWLRTGDIGYYNEEYNLFISDRLKELIKVKGFQVAPAELEEIIRDYPSIEDAAVIGVPHPIFGEVPRAYVVPKKQSSVNPEELDKHVTKKVAPYKKLAGGIEIVDTIPKNPAGKILRKKIKDQYLLNNP